MNSWEKLPSFAQLFDSSQLSIKHLIAERVVSLSLSLLLVTIGRPIYYTNLKMFGMVAVFKAQQNIQLEHSRRMAVYTKRTARTDVTSQLCSELLFENINDFSGTLTVLHDNNKPTKVRQ